MQIRDTSTALLGPPKRGCPEVMSTKSLILTGPGEQRLLMKRPGRPRHCKMSTTTTRKIRAPTTYLNLARLVVAHSAMFLAKRTTKVAMKVTMTRRRRRLLQDHLDTWLQSQSWTMMTVQRSGLLASVTSANMSR
jgi:hypothetical protein